MARKNELSFVLTDELEGIFEEAWQKFIAEKLEGLSPDEKSLYLFSLKGGIRNIAKAILISCFIKKHKDEIKRHPLFENYLKGNGVFLSRCLEMNSNNKTAGTIKTETFSKKFDAYGYISIYTIKNMYKPERGGSKELVDLYCAAIYENLNMNFYQHVKKHQSGSLGINDWKVFNKYKSEKKYDYENQVKNYIDENVEKNKLLGKKLDEKTSKQVTKNRLYLHSNTFPQNDNNNLELSSNNRKHKTPIVNQWRFWLDRKNSIHAQKIWADLKRLLDLKSNNLANNIPIIFSALDQYIIQCQRDTSILEKNGFQDLQEHIDNKSVFPDEASVLELFDRSSIVDYIPKNHEGKESGGWDLRSLDVFVSFISHLQNALPTTFQKYLNLTDKKELATFLTSHSKKRRNKLKNKDKDIFDDGNDSWDSIYMDISNWEANETLLEETNDTEKWGTIPFYIIIIFIILGIYSFWIYKPTPPPIITSSPIVSDSTFTIAIAPLLKTSGNNLVEFDYIIKQELKKYNFNKKGMNVKIIDKQHSSLKNVSNTQIADKQDARKVAESIGADVIIWANYVTHTNQDSFTFSLNSLWVGNFDTLMPFGSPQWVMQKIQQKHLPKMLVLKEYTATLPKKVHTAAYLYGEQYAKHIKYLIKWIYFLQLKKINKPFQAFNILKEEYNNDYSLRLILDLFQEAPIIRKSFEEFYQKNNNFYINATLANFYFEKCRKTLKNINYPVITNDPSTRQFFEKAFQYSTKAINSIKNLKNIHKNKQPRFNTTFLSKYNLFYISSTYQYIFKRDLKKALTLINQGIESYPIKTPALNASEMPQVELLFQAPLNKMMWLKMSIEISNNSLITAYLTGLKTFEYMGITCDNIFKNNQYPLSIYAQIIKNNIHSLHKIFNNHEKRKSQLNGTKYCKLLSLSKKQQTTLNQEVLIRYSPIIDTTTLPF